MTSLLTQVAFLFGPYLVGLVIYRVVSMRFPQRLNWILWAGGVGFFIALATLLVLLFVRDANEAQDAWEPYLIGVFWWMVFSIGLTGKRPGRPGD